LKLLPTSIFLIDHQKFIKVIGHYVPKRAGSLLTIYPKGQSFDVFFIKFWEVVRKQEHLLDAINDDTLKETTSKFKPRKIPAQKTG
jgi:hypothetical protein